MGNLSCRKQDCFYETLENDRAQGRALLRKLIKSDDIDWESLIATADFLHKSEQKKLRQRERRFRMNQRKKAVLRSKKYRAIGSFSVNLITMLQDDSRNSTGGDTWQQKVAAIGATCSTESSGDEMNKNRTYDLASVDTPPMHA
jgi:hypothetical protein